ncbi:hypothetical protein V5O48_010307 [Marasmius crinis-equi]|uniref:Uncharacterized protein n=1 Tax=Marasmius crinis-equi TaxID=585013 RepID=A0ABR3F9B7_9AGAR
MSSHISSTSYASRTKELLALINQLRAVGAQTELDLPRIAVIGNQSAGKSSVVEAISGINVPRDAGTCTRCPMECRLSSSSGNWSCSISIRTEYDAQGQALNEVKEETFGPTITEKCKVENALRKAQFAVLNPSISHRKILAAGADELQGLAKHPSLSFSRNVVCIDLEGPELTDLSFIDLPGIIQNAPEESTIALVENMVLSHIGGNCLILVALPMTDDIENQKALRLAKKVDPTGHRTIGVMTKPDMLGPGSKKALELWLDVIEGKRHPLSHGYYCTRQPNDDERSKNITSSGARKAESEFFESTLPWAQSTHKHRFGTTNLSTALSNHLITIINESMPRITQEAFERLQSCKKELEQIPTAIVEDPATYLLNAAIAFSTEFQQSVDGDTGDSTELIQTHKRSYERFKHAIRSTAPVFSPLLDNEQQPSMSTSSREADPSHIVYNLTSMRNHIKESVTRELPNNVPFKAKASLIQEFQKNWPDAAEECFEQVQRATQDFLFDMIEDRFKRHSRLRGDMRNHVRELLDKHSERCLMFVDASLGCEQTPFTQNTHYLQTCTEKWLARYKSTRANRGEPVEKGAAASSTSQNPPSPLKETRPMAPLPKRAGKPAHSGEPETAQPSPAPAKEKQAPTHPGPAEKAEKKLSPEDLNELLSTLAKFGYTGLTEEDLGKLTPADEYETELQVMAEVRGYFQVAYKRVIDAIPCCMDLHFLKALGKEMQPFLVTKLGLGTSGASERCARYLAEDPEIVARRNELLARRQRLESVQRELSNFDIAID